MLELSVEPVEHVEVLTHALGVLLDLVLVEGFILNSLVLGSQILSHSSLVLLDILDSRVQCVNIVLNSHIAFMDFLNKSNGLQLPVFKLALNKLVLSFDRHLHLLLFLNSLVKKILCVADSSFNLLEIFLLSRGGLLNKLFKLLLCNLNSQDGFLRNLIMLLLIRMNKAFDLGVSLGAHLAELTSNLSLVLLA